MELESQLATFRRLKVALDARIDEVRAATAELEAQSFEAWSEQRTVRAVVNGQGALLDLEIAPDSLDRTHPRALGQHIVRSVAAARARAAEAHRARFHPVLPGIFPSEGDQR